MSQIVYDGKHLYADRKLYDGDLVSGLGYKLRTTILDDVTYHYAFVGEYAHCSIGESVVASGFDPEVCKWAIDRLANDEGAMHCFFGVVVEVPHNVAPVKHKVYLVNYMGDKCECVAGEFLVVGKFEQTIRDMYRMAKLFGTVQTDQLIRFALNGTSQQQVGYVIDRVNLRTGEYEEV